MRGFSGRAMALRRSTAAAACLLALSLAACKRETKVAVPEPRPVRTTTVELAPRRETFVLTGHVQAEDEVSFAFRIGGRMIERPVNVGDRLEPGQLIAKLDPQNEINEFRAARAAVEAARAALRESQAAYDRQRTLLAQGHTPRAQYDQAERILRTAEAQLVSAEAQQKIASDRVSFTMLTADAPGTVTARGAEPGEVVQAGQMIVQVARQGGRDAVFDVPAQLLRTAPPNPTITVRLTDDPSVTALGRVREVAPQADPVTRTFQVRVGLTDPPAAMRLGATVNGQVEGESTPVVAIPATALTEVDRKPAVWIVDPAKLTVSLHPIEVASFDPAQVIVASGLAPGDIVVTAGVHALHPDQPVRLLPARK